MSAPSRSPALNLVSSKYVARYSLGSSLSAFEGTYQFPAPKEPPIEFLDCSPRSGHTSENNEYSETLRRIHWRRFNQMLYHPLNNSTCSARVQVSREEHTHISNIPRQSLQTDPHRYRPHHLPARPDKRSDLLPHTCPVLPPFSPLHLH